MSARVQWKNALSVLTDWTGQKRTNRKAMAHLDEQSAAFAEHPLPMQGRGLFCIGLEPIGRDLTPQSRFSFSDIAVVDDPADKLLNSILTEDGLFILCDENTGQPLGIQGPQAGFRFLGGNYLLTLGL